MAWGWATQEDAALRAVPTLLVLPPAQRPCWAHAGVCRAWGMLLPTQAPSRGTGDSTDAQEAVSLVGRWGSTLSQEEGLSPPSHCLHSCSCSRFAFVEGGGGADTCPWPPCCDCPLTPLCHPTTHPHITCLSSAFHLDHKVPEGRTRFASVTVKFPAASTGPGIQ